jgi:hypothetical protein
MTGLFMVERARGSIGVVVRPALGTKTLIVKRGGGTDRRINRGGTGLLFGRYLIGVARLGSDGESDP